MGTGLIVFNSLRLSNVCQAFRPLFYPHVLCQHRRDKLKNSDRASPPNSLICQ